LNVYWLDYSGKRSFQGTMEPGSGLYEGTFLAQPFLVTDANNVGLFIVMAESQPPSSGTWSANAAASGVDYRQTPAIDHHQGFAAHNDISANGSTIFSGTSALLTPSINWLAGTVFANRPVNVSQFATSFTFLINNFGGDPILGIGADGITFIIQSNSPQTVGAAGGDIGYTGIPNSVAVKFDIFQNGLDPSNNCTGLFTGGNAPLGGIDLSPTGLNLRSGDLFRADLDYDGANLNVLITDTQTKVSAAQSYAINIPAAINFPMAYVGFSASTGASNATQSIAAWNFEAAPLVVVGNNDSTIEAFNGAGIGTQFNVSGNVNGPYALAYNLAGFLFVANSNDNTIDVFNGAGAGVKVNFNGDLNAPRGLAFDQNSNLYVSNFGDNTIEKFNLAGVGTKFNVSGDLNQPFGLAFDTTGNLYVANRGDNTIEKFNQAGVGTKFNVSGNLNAPRGLAFDSAGNLYVTNKNDNTIEKFNSAGIGTQFNVSGDLNQPAGLAFDTAGNLYVANQGDNTIEVFNSAGIGVPYNIAGHLNLPLGLAIAPDTANLVYSISVNPASVFGGSAATGTVTLNGPSPAGGSTVTLSSSDPSAIVPATVTVPAGAISMTFPVTTVPVGVTTASTLTGSLNGIPITTSFTVQAPQISSFTVSPASVAGGGKVAASIKLTSPAPAGGETVTIQSNNAAVPSSQVTIAAGATSGSVSILTGGVDASTAVTLTASAGGVSKTAVVTVTPAVLNALTVSPNPTYGGNNTIAAVLLNGLAGPSGIKAALSSSDGTTIPAGTIVNIPAGASKAAYTFIPAVVTTPTTMTITATAGAVSKAVVLTVNPAVLTTLTVPTTVSGGAIATIKAALSSPAPAGGLTVTVTSNSPALSVGSGTIAIAAGATSGTLTATTIPVDSDTPVTVTATLGSVTKTATITVKAALLSSLSVGPNPAYGGNKTTASVILTGKTGPSGLTVSLSSSDGTTIPAGTTLNIPAGAINAAYSFTPAVVTTSKTVTITATQGAISKSAVLTVNPAVLTTLSASSVYSGQSDPIKATLSSPAPAGGLTITVTSNSPALSVGSGTITIAAGATSGTLTATTIPVDSDTPVTLSASLGGVTKTASVVVKAATLLSMSISPNPAYGGNKTTAAIALNGQAGPSGLTVALSSSDAITIPTGTSVTIPAGAINFAYSFTPAVVTAPKTVTITATQGAISKPVVLTVNPAVLTTLSAASVYGGQAAAIKATLSSPAPAGGLTVTITSNSPALSVGSGTIAIAAGATIGTLIATTAPVNSDTPVSLSASLGSVTKTASVVVKAAVLSSLIASPTSVQNGKTVTFKVILGSASPTGGLAVSLSGGSTILPVPASITVPAGSSNAIATVTAAGATSSTQVTVTATLGSVTKTVTVTVSP